MVSVKSYFDSSSNTVTHIVWDEQSCECAIIDAVLDFDAAAAKTSTQSADCLLDFIREHSLKLKYLLETHVHADHLSAAPYLREQTGAPILIGEDTQRVEVAFRPYFASDEASTKQSVRHCFDRLLADGEQFNLGEQSITVIATPGHTAGCITYAIADMAFVGDTLFMPDFGTARADFPGGDARRLYRSIQKILALPENTRLFMCHDYKAKGRDEYAWETTVARQREQNIHINVSVSEDEFVKFREKRDQGLSMPKLLLPAVQVNLCAGELPEPAENGIRYLKIPLNQF